MKSMLKNPVLVLVFSVFLAFIASYPAFWLVNSEYIEKNSLSFLYIADLSALLIMFILPLGIITYIYKENMREFGLRYPENPKLATKMSLLVVLVLLPIIYWLSKTSSFDKYYSIEQGFGSYFLLATLGSAVYFIGEEFLFRGFLFFGLWEKLKFHSFWIINIIFAIIHIGKPALEVLFAFVAGLMFTYLSYRTKSFIPAVIVHFVIALILNIFVIISR